MPPHISREQRLQFFKYFITYWQDNRSDRQTDSLTNNLTDGQITNIKTDRLSDWKNDRMNDWKTDSLTDWQSDRLIAWKTDRLKDWYTGWQTNKPRPTDHQIKIQIVRQANCTSFWRGSLELDSVSRDNWKCFNFLTLIRLCLQLQKTNFS